MYIRPRPNEIAAGFRPRHFPKAETVLAVSYKTALKRDANFPLEIHIFFSSKKNVNRLRKTHAFQDMTYLSGYEQNKILFQNITKWTWKGSLRKGEVARPHGIRRGKSSPQNFYRRGTGTSFHRPISNGRTLHHWNIRPTKNLNYQ